MAYRQIANSLQMTRPFLFFHDVTISSFDLNSDLPKISEWGFKCFNPEPTKPAQEVIFSGKLKTVPHP